MIKKTNKRSIKYQYETLRDLDFFLSKNYTLTSTLEILSENIFFQQLSLELEKGRNLSYYLEQQNFSHDILVAVKIGEQSGNINQGIKSAKEIIEKKQKLQQELIEEIKYPIILFIFAILSCMFISNFLLPQFILIYQSYTIEFSPLFKGLYIVMKYFPYLIIIIILLGVIGYKFSITEKNYKINYFLKMKLFYKYYQYYYNLHLINNLIVFLQMKFTVEECLLSLKDNSNDQIFSTKMEIILEKLEKGISLEESLDDFYYDSLIKVVKNGRKANMLLGYLDDYLYFLKLERNKSKKNYVLMIQPIIYLFIGIIIIFMYLMMFIPMFKIMDSI